MNNMVNWIFAKIVTNLKNKEGCEIGQVVKSHESLRTVVQDALGFRYEVEVKCLGRIHTDPREINWNSNKEIM